jgi:DNA (cytosine-5)-methyltransferase 1
MRYGSVCSGIEAASAAWHPLRWEPAFFSEIEAFPRAVLAARWSGVPVHGDFRTIEAGQYGSIDLLVGGTPCQDFSVAGLRAGLAGERGGLTIEFVELARRLRPRWLVWENVPGILSIDDGRAFGAFLGLLGECGYGFAYRVLDAQYFGVPQRRRRVILVGYLGDWRPAAAVLFEPESLRGDPAPRREAGQGVARPIASCARGGSGYRNGCDTADNLIPETAGSLSSRATAGGGLGADFECGGGLIPLAQEIVPPLVARSSRRGAQPLSPGFTTDGHITLAYGGGNTSAPIEVTTAARTKERGDFDTETFVAAALRARDSARGVDSDCTDTLVVADPVSASEGRTYSHEGAHNFRLHNCVTHALDAHSGGQATEDGTGGGVPLVTHALRAEGFDASEDGSGRGTPLIPVMAAGAHGANGAGIGVDGDPMFTLDSTGAHAVALNLRGRDGGSQFESDDLASLRAAPGRGSRSYAFAENSRAELRLEGGDGQTLAALKTGGGKAGQSYPAVASIMAVRRLTPVECERLQGFPDGYTAVTYRGKPAADGPRYRALGNSMAVPVMRWVGERIALIG